MYRGTCSYCGVSYSFRVLPRENKCESCGALIDFIEIKEQNSAIPVPEKPPTLQEKMDGFNKKLEKTASEVVRPVNDNVKRRINTGRLFIYISFIVVFTLGGSIIYDKCLSEANLEKAYFSLLILIALLLASIFDTVYIKFEKQNFENKIPSLYKQYESDYQMKLRIVLSCLNKEEKQVVLDKKMTANKMSYNDFCKYVNRIISL